MKEPYLLQEKGWGEFDMRVVLFFTNNLAEPENIFFDLHFREPTYTILHKIHFQNPSPELIKLLSIELPSTDTQQISDHNLKKRRTSPSSSSSTTKKIKTPPSMSSPAQFSDGPLTPSSTYYNNNKYPPSPAIINNNHQHQQQHQQQQQDQDLFSNTMASDDLFRAIHGFRQNIDEDIIIDDVYQEKDLDTVNPIHGKLIEDSVRMAWGLPEGLDMLELAKRLSLRTPEQTEEIEALIKNHKRDGIYVEENDDEFIVDLYSLGPELLNQLWDYTERKKMSSRTALSPFSLVQANTIMIEDD
ncbi:hypothetical protein EDC94DRAFT_626495 [Helicostylum pulchrum]|nr:hypothetical protein EDC94DRAFT_626495 [Helicostylum pulchrum]